MHVSNGCLGQEPYYRVMRYWIGITDYDWYRFLASQSELSEVNFWQPSAGGSGRSLCSTRRTSSRTA